MGQLQSALSQTQSLNKNKQVSQQVLKQQAKSQNSDKPLKYKYDGLIKCQSFPFNGSVTYQSVDNETYYLQKNTSLQIQLMNRITFSQNLVPQQNLNGKKINFSKTQVIRIIQSVVYALADMQNNQIIYKDINLQNICLINKTNANHDYSFQVKLMPNNFIEKSSYQKLLQYEDEDSGHSDHKKQFNFSPQMIIAYRCHQKAITDIDILHKSNIYALGVALISVCTLQKFECYDSQTFDIYQDEIQKQLQIIEELYGLEISRIIANMLDYDYEQRMDPIQFAFWLNKQLQQINAQQQGQEEKEKENCVSDIKIKKVNKKQPQQPYQPQQQKQLKSRNNQQTDTNPEQRKIQIRTKVVYITSQIEQPPSTYKFMNKYPKIQTAISSKRLVENPYVKDLLISKQTTQRSTYKQKNLNVPIKSQQFQLDKQNKLSFININTINTNTKGNLLRQNPYLNMRKNQPIRATSKYSLNQSQQVSKFQYDNSNSFRNQPHSSFMFRQNYGNQIQNNSNVSFKFNRETQKNELSSLSKRQQKFALFDQKKEQLFYQRHQKLSFSSCQKSEGDLIGISSSRKEIQRIKKQIQRSKKLIMEFDSLNKRKG